MDPMGTHADVSAAAGRPLRRAHAAAWFTFIFMAGTTIAFQTYHSVKNGQMPLTLAVLYGTAAFILAITVLEFARHCGRWVRAGAYILTGGAMFLSASATGAVVLHAAPAHWSLLFGFLLDGAAILSIYFIFDGPTAAQAVAEVARREAELTAQAGAHRRALDDAQRAHRAALADARSAHEQETAELLARLDAERAAREEAQAESALHASAEAERDLARAEMDGARAGLQAAQDARAEAEARAARLEADNARLARKAGAQNGGSRARKPAAERAPGAVPKDVDARAEALSVYLADPTISGAQLGPAVGMSKRWGQDRMKEFKTSVVGGEAAPSDS